MYDVYTDKIKTHCPKCEKESEITFGDFKISLNMKKVDVEFVCSSCGSKIVFSYVLSEVL